MDLPNYRVYGDYSGNYGVHCLSFRMNGVSVWFSYNTLVAFQVGDNPRVVSENLWGPTTGKHLKAIDGGNKKARVDRIQFEQLWREQTGENDRNRVKRVEEMIEDFDEAECRKLLDTLKRKLR